MPRLSNEAADYLMMDDASEESPIDIINAEIRAKKNEIAAQNAAKNAEKQRILAALNTPTGEEFDDIIGNPDDIFNRGERIEFDDLSEGSYHPEDRIVHAETLREMEENIPLRRETIYAALNA